ncbi:hypothetical protein JCM10021v2_001644 [Rhodotorula toruloides]
MRFAPHVPGLPTAQDRFATADEAYLAYVRALVPVYGIGVVKHPTSNGDIQVKCNRHRRPPTDSVPCEWTAVLKQNSKSGRWRIDFDESNFEHSHGPAKRILQDPSWRPIVRNREARKALGIDSDSAEQREVGQDRAAAARAAKKERAERKKVRDRLRNKDKGKDVALQSKGKERAHDASPPPKKRRRDTNGTLAPGPSPPTTSLFFACPQPSTSASPSSHEFAFEHEAPEYRPLAYPPTFASLPATRPFSASLSAHPVSPAPSSLVPLPTVDVSAFLFALHPSLETLTPHLVASGFTTVDSLASLALLDPAILNNVLDLVQGDESEGQSPRAGFRVFGRRAKIEWTAETESAAMRDLVERRELIFQHQRELNNARLQANSEKLAKEHLAQFSTRNNTPASNLNLYKRFCKLVDVPPYPITFALLSLAMFARCSTKNGHFATFKLDLQHIMQATASPWEGEAMYEALVGKDPNGTALKEFMDERRKVQLKRASRFPSAF